MGQFLSGVYKSRDDSVVVEIEVKKEEEKIVRFLRNETKHFVTITPKTIIQNLISKYRAYIEEKYKYDQEDYET